MYRENLTILVMILKSGGKWLQQQKAQKSGGTEARGSWFNEKRLRWSISFVCLQEPRYFWLLFLADFGKKIFRKGEAKRKIQLTVMT